MLALVLVGGSCATSPFGTVQEASTEAELGRGPLVKATTITPSSVSTDDSQATSESSTADVESEKTSEAGMAADGDGDSGAAPGPKSVEQLLDELLDGTTDVNALIDRLAADGTLRRLVGSSHMMDRFGAAGPGGLSGGLTIDPAIAECVSAPDGVAGILESAGNDADQRPVEKQLADTARWLENERGDEFAGPLRFEVLTSDEIARRIRDLATDTRDHEQLDVEQRLLTTLGALGPNVSLGRTQDDLQGAQVSGYYDADRTTLVIRADDPDAPLDAADLATLAHELDHTLIAPHLDLPLGADGVVPGADARRAALAVAEGDATLAMQRFGLTEINTAELLLRDTDASLGQAPHFVTQSFLFPYLAGIVFMCDLYREGGWPAVSEAYANLPATSAQIMYPDRFRSGEDAEFQADLARPGGVWEPIGADTFGAAELLWLFEAPGDQRDAALDDPRGRAAAWAGGSYQLWAADAASAVGITLADRGETVPLCDSMRAWYAAAFPTADWEQIDPTVTVFRSVEQHAAIACAGSDVIVAIAPDLATAAAIADVAIPEPEATATTTGDEDS